MVKTMQRQSRTEYMVDPDDFCRACDGNGREYSPAPNGATLSEPCFYCGGSGHRSVSIVHPASEALQ